MDQKTTFIATLVVERMRVSRESDEVTVTLCGVDLEQQKDLRIVATRVSRVRFDAVFEGTFELHDFRLSDIGHWQRQGVNFLLTDESLGILHVECHDVSVNFTS